MRPSIVLAVLSLALLSIVSPIVAVSSKGVKQPTDFNFYDYLIGEWDVVKSELNAQTASHEVTEPMGRYQFIKSSDADQGLLLVGRYHENDTLSGAVVNDLSVSVEFESDSKSSGVWKIGASESASTSPLFSFNFVMQPGQLPTSVGKWMDDDAPAYYLLSINQPDRFSIVITRDSIGQTKSFTMFSLKKIVVDQPKTFWQSYGTWVIMGGVFILNIWIKQKTKNWGAAAAATTVAPGGAAPAGRTAAAPATANKKAK